MTYDFLKEAISAQMENIAGWKRQIRGYKELLRREEIELKKLKAELGRRQDD